MPRQMPSSGHAVVHPRSNRADPRVAQRPRRAEVSDARHDDACARLVSSSGRTGTNTSAPTAASAFFTDVRLPAP